MLIILLLDFISLLLLSQYHTIGFVLADVLIVVIEVVLYLYQLAAEQQGE
jgi:hypothetical protein